MGTWIEMPLVMVIAKPLTTESGLNASMEWIRCRQLKAMPRESKVECLGIVEQFLARQLDVQ